MKIKRNDKCICDSNKKYKKCCWKDSDKRFLIEECYDTRKFGKPYCDFILSKIKQGEQVNE